MCCETSRSSIRQSICMASFKHTECNTRHRGHHSLSSNPSDPPNLTKQIRLLAVRKQSRSLARLRAASDSGTKQKVAESKQSSESTKGNPSELLGSGLPPPSVELSPTGVGKSTHHGSVKNATARYDLPSPALAVRNLVEQAKIAHLCTLMSNMHHRRAGFPFGTLTDFASDGSGFPIFCLSPVAIHTRNIQEDSRCSLIVQLPGWSGLANARVTIFGDVYQLPPNLQRDAKEIFNRKQAAERKDGWVMGNNIFFRMHRISDIYFVGGFGTVQWVDVAEYAATSPDSIVLDNPHKTLQILNERHADTLRKVMSHNNQPAEDAAFISIDRRGTDVRIRHGNEYCVERLGFDFHVHTLDHALSATSQLLNHGISPQMQRSSVAPAL